MVCINGRINLLINAQRQLFSEAAGFCQRCGQYLFISVGDSKVSVAEMAHIVAAQADGPRGASTLGSRERAEPGNIVLLCPTCHTLVDKAPDEFPVEMLLKWKEQRRRMLLDIVGVARYRDREEARRGIEPILRTNRHTFDEYGPLSATSDHPDDEAGHAWRRKVVEIILPNNRRLVAICDVNRELLTTPELAVVEDFRQHVDDLEARHIHGKLEPGSRQFPPGLNGIFEDNR
jgi:hypothetical protein